MTAATAQPDNLRDQVRKAVIWRSGTQIVSQLIAWASTFLVIRILSPSDYGLYAMTSVVLVLLGLLNGYSFANAVIQDRSAGREQLRQLFGLLIVVNGALALAQVLTAPLVAAYFHQPQVADLLRVQALIYLTNPFLSLGYAVLAREMDFRKQAQVNMASAVIGALVALAGRWAGWVSGRSSPRRLQPLPAALSGWWPWPARGCGPASISARPAAWRPMAAWSWPGRFSGSSRPRLTSSSPAGC